MQTIKSVNKSNWQPTSLISYDAFLTSNENEKFFSSKSRNLPLHEYFYICQRKQ